MKKFLALLLCVQLVLCAGVGLASQFISEMIRQQNLNLDACSGATFSCEGVREAVKNALGK